MGAGSSKPEASAGSKHVFTSNSPVQFSSNLVDSLQSNTETDSARAKALELQIQARVSEELERLRAREQQTLAEIEKRLAEVRETAASQTSSSSSTSSSTPNIAYPPGSLNLDAPRIPFAGREATPAPAPENQKPINLDVSRDSVNSEIEELRARLEGRRRLAQLDEEAEKARADVVGCLRLNDRRPLNCWKEVESFKREVAKMEEAFVDRIVG
ncbi:Mic19 family protein [Aspergillus saccharolyticus JOP 1030-1]|uniref:Altered inheritance of mitochondria protein 13, mitochondrial n=1 Tax=Aspergillus saccharolyticus JOP 1030-1 TaxID=1450539 RepID=A0A318ZDF8_9EURO|nr:altered inheritance of mitochondria protein 13, mitochondrial [Aspergillus saccharolyticus JOP 1030-1]PYH45375.1 altered inheritance of mitochondria protein 13, mitochondrial [Aspergillus saccharolyticus JOP 1030-1]